MLRVFSLISRHFQLKPKQVLGYCHEIPADVDVIIFGHSLADVSKITWPYRGVHFIRDPRDIIISGYLYHMRCSEEWCINTDFSTETPILFPRVPASQVHKPESWKRNYLQSLGGKSYQQNLRDRSEAEGILYEMKHYGAWTIKSMLDWDYNNRNIREFRFEQLMSDYNDTFREIFMHLGFSGNSLEKALELSATEDLNNKSDAQILNGGHISSRQTTKWHRYFNEKHKKTFRKLFGNALVELGYESDDNW